MAEVNEIESSLQNGISTLYRQYRTYSNQWERYGIERKFVRCFRIETCTFCTLVEHEKASSALLLFSLCAESARKSLSLSHCGISIYTYTVECGNKKRLLELARIHRRIIMNLSLNTPDTKQPTKCCRQSRSSNFLPS